MTWTIPDWYQAQTVSTGLADAAGRATKTYSGGMRRRLDLAASLVGRPRLHYLDEPTTASTRGPGSTCGRWCAGWLPTGQPCCSPLSTSRRRTPWPTRSRSSTAARVIATGSPLDLKARTGAQTLAVRPADAGDLPTVRWVVAELVGAEPELEGNLVTAPVTDPAVLPAVVRRLDDDGVVITELTLRNSSLNEVFLSLTGHPAEDTGTTGDGTAGSDRREGVPA